MIPITQKWTAATKGTPKGVANIMHVCGAARMTPRLPRLVIRMVVRNYPCRAAVTRVPRFECGAKHYQLGAANPQAEGSEFTWAG